MKYNKIIFATLLPLFVAGCSDEVEVNRTLPVSGEEIMFGALVDGFSSSASRTIYQLPEDEPGKFDSYSKLEIKWETGKDQVRVYSPDASSECQYADYTVQNDPTYGDYLVKNGTIGIRWGEPTAVHNFYAFYPLGKITEGLQGKTEVKASIPTAQEHGELLTSQNSSEVIKDDTWKIIAPDMSYCMMAGTGKWNPSSNSEKNVSLEFTPLVSVLDVVINGPQNQGDPSYNIVLVSVRSEDQDIVGDFTYNYATGTFSFDEDTGGDNRIATVSCTQTVNGEESPISLGPKEKLNVKFFLLPRDISASKLTVSVFMEGGYVLTQSLSGTGTASDGTTAGDGVLAQGKITRVITPYITAPTTNNWMSLIGDNVLFSQLSLPGTHQSYTASINVGSNYDPETDISQKYQDLNVADGEDNQFDAGVRAFDVDIEIDGNQGYVYAAGKRVDGDITLSRVLNALYNKINPSPGVTDPTECAVLFLNYVNNGVGADDWTRYVSNLLSTWSSSHSSVLQTLGSNTTMGDMRGKIAVIMNLPSSQTPTVGNVNYIENYGTSRQNLNIRELVYNGSSTVYVQNLMQVNNQDITDYSGGNMWNSFTYAHRDGLGLVPYFITEAVGSRNPAGIEDCNLLGRKVDLMEQMMEQIKNDGGHSLFINDLSGFCVVKDVNSVGWSQYTTYTSSNRFFVGLQWGTGFSHTIYDYEEKPTSGYDFMQEERPTPEEENQTWLQFHPYDSGSDKSEGGNSALFAELFNEQATQAISNLVETGRVPMGIVMMNFAGSATVTWDRDYQVQGIRMPGLVMSNNFLFELKTNGSN